METLNPRRGEKQPIRQRGSGFWELFLFLLLIFLLIHIGLSLSLIFPIVFSYIVVWGVTFFASYVKLYQ